MTEPGNNKIGVNDYKRLSRQNNLLFVAGAVSVLTGLFFPAVPALVDLLIIFSLALSASLIVICLCAGKPSELTGFALLAVTSIASLLTAAIASAKLAVIADTAGLIAGHAASLDIISSFLPAGLSAAAFAAISVLLLTATEKSAGKLLQNSKSHLEEITAVEQAQPEFNFLAAENNRENLTAKEKGFFYAAYAFGRLAVWLCVLISAVVMLGLFGAALAGKMLVSLVAGTGIIIQASAFFAVFAVSHLTRKIVLQSSQQHRMTEEQFQQRIKVVAREVAAAQTDDYLHYYSSGESGATNLDFMFDCNEFDDESSYECITNILVESGDDKVLVIAACGPQYAPVTIPVNIAVRLAARGLKTLIMDFDLKRFSVQRVFETGNCNSRAVKTCIENISLISGERLACANPQALRYLFTKAEKLYDYILVYAPDTALPQQMSEFFTTAMFFGPDSSPAAATLDNFIEELGTTACQVLTPRHLFQPA